MTARPPKPIESFGAEIFQSLIEGAKRKIEFHLPYRKAIHFRQRANQLRSTMRAQNHEHAPMISQAKISISWPEGTEVVRSSRGVRGPKDLNTLCTVVISPSDSEFTDVLKGAGVTVPELSDPVKSTISDADDILASFIFPKN